MALWFKLKVNAEDIGFVEIRRQEILDLTDPAIADSINTYDVFRDGKAVGSLMHRYGDEAWRLLADAADLIAEEDGHAALHHGCAEYMAGQVRSLRALDVVDLIAAAIRHEGGDPKTNGEMVQRLIDLIADRIELLPHDLKAEAAAGPVTPASHPARPAEEPT